MEKREFWTYFAIWLILVLMSWRSAAADMTCYGTSTLRDGTVMVEESR